MNIKSWIKPFFVIAALYDGILGLVGTFTPMWLFNTFKVPPPNHLGYVQFPALLLIVFAIIMLNVASAPKENRNLITYCILLKLAYCSVIFTHWFFGNMPLMWIPFAFCDFGFLLIFALAYIDLK